MRAEEERLCFGCSKANPEGLRMSIWRQGEEVWGELVTSAHHQGFPGHVHGGVIAAALDEAMGWAVYHKGYLAATAHLDVKYRAPLNVGERARVRARVVKARGRRIMVQAVMEDASGRGVAEGWALFLRPPPGAPT